MSNWRRKKPSKGGLYKQKNSGPNLKQRLREALIEKKKNDIQDASFGYARLEEGQKVGWLLNLHQTVVSCPEKGTEASAVDCYFIEEDGETFKATVLFRPYFYLCCKEDLTDAVTNYILKRFEEFIHNVETVQKVDLDHPNHLSKEQLTKKYLKVTFDNQPNLKWVKRQLIWKILANQKKSKNENAFELFAGRNKKQNVDLMQEITDIREHDMEYISRFCIDTNLRIGCWHKIIPMPGDVHKVKRLLDMVKPQDCRVLAYDIETTKAPLKFPVVETDQVMMISYMIDGEGYLITNREIVNMDIEDFEYTPKPEYEGNFEIFNEENERALLERFFEHIRDVRPHVYVTYNGDFFDWPFVEARALHHNIDMNAEIGVYSTNGIYGARFAPHIDCYNWVKRDSYLPQGSQGLKSVTKKKLGYNPVELDPELMTPYARDKPAELATYSVSDAVATYYLYKKYVESFIFSLCTIIPYNSGDVLRKGSGGLCEALLMAEAFDKNIIAPNKQNQRELKFHHGHLLDSETYIGGKVEAFEEGVFREDIPVEFAMEPEAYQELIDDVPATIEFFLRVECDPPLTIDDVTNYEEVRDKLVEELKEIQSKPRCVVKPLIYHLDVSAMYPNIILTNKLQPVAIVNDTICASCDFNRKSATCKRTMPWRWRGKYYPAKNNEVRQLTSILEHEPVDLKEVQLTDWQSEKARRGEIRRFHDLNKEQQHSLIKKRVKGYSQQVYRKLTVEVEEDKQSTICQRENGFYVDTVRNFRDRRYKFKGLKKKWWGKFKESKNPVEKQNNAQMVTLYDSLQLAHKCILNSFYGYVMRTGSRWYSMDMAAVTTFTGANMIKDAYNLCRRIGRPLELDTDGIWTCVPGTFPENYTFYTKNYKKKKVVMEYCGSMLNIMTHRNFTNDQFAELTDASERKYSTRSECSLFFEVDGPYLSMFLPASTEEGKKLKKRYAVFNRDGSCAELKGFELKRRGELKIIKYFQEEVFSTFLKGEGLQGIYEHVAKVAKRYLDILETKADSITDEYLFELITTHNNMSKSIEEYGGRKSTAITCAKRLAEFLGDGILRGGKLACKFIISQKPIGASTSERAVPIQIFKAEPHIMKTYIRKWLRDSSLSNFDPRNIIDWDYYMERFGKNVQKIVTIPAAMQSIQNPIPTLHHPPWLAKKIREKNDPFRQRKLTNFFKKRPPPSKKKKVKEIVDVEDLAEAMPRMSLDGQTQDEEMEEVQITPKKQIKKPIEIEVEEKLVKPDLPDMKEDFQDWHSKSRTYWKQLRKRRRKRKIEELGSGNAPPSAKRYKKGYASKNLLAMMDNLTAKLYDNSWHVVQVAPGDFPGQYILWSMINGESMQPIRVLIERDIYINIGNCPKANELLQGGGRKVHRKLPRERPMLNLIKLTMKESEFLDDKSNIALFLGHPQVEGVYETQVPLDLKVICELGNVSRICNTTRKDSEKHLRRGFGLDEVMACANTSPDEYLNRKEFQIQKIFLYHSVSEDGKRGVVGVFIADKEDPNTYHAQVHVVSPGRANAEQFNCRSFAQKEAAEHGLELNLEIVREQFDSLEAAYKATQKCLIKYKKNSLGKPTVILNQSCITLEEFYEVMPGLRTEFPIVSIPYDIADAQYPSLSWYSSATKRMIQRLIFAADAWEDRIKFARVSKIPIGNLPATYSFHHYANDVRFGRLLKHAKQLWWTSGGTRPDLGGIEEDENCFDDECENPIITNEGVYDKIVVSLKLRSLAANALVKAHLIDRGELVGSMMDDVETGAKDDDKMQVENVKKSIFIVDDSTKCKYTFKTLVTLLKQMVRDHERMKNYKETILEQIENLYSWIRDPNSNFYDPLLHRMVHKLLKKVFYRLLQKLQEMGCEIVHASFEKIVISTRKTSRENADAFIQNLSNTLSASQAFNWIELEVSHTFSYFLYLDNFNWMAFRCIDQSAFQELSEEEQAEAILDEQNKCYHIRGQALDIGSHLPDKLCDKLEHYVAEFLHPCFVESRNFFAALSQTQHTQDQSEKKNIVKKFANFKVNEMRTLSHEIFELTTHMTERFPSDSSVIGTGNHSAVFPTRCGTHLELWNPSLEFTKYLTKLLSLDLDVENEVRALKRSMLKIINVQESQADFTNPSLSYILPGVRCQYCNRVRDLDICRDILSEDNEWLCDSCDRPYDNDVVENQLVDIVIRKNASFHTQDLICGTCKAPKSSYLSEYCPCAGGIYRNHTSTNEFRTNLHVFQRIAQFHKLPLLQETVDWMLNS